MKLHKHQICCILYYTLFFTTTLVWAQTSYEGEGIVTLSHITPEEARAEALNLARQDALSKARLEVVGYTSSSLTELSTKHDNQVYDYFTRFVRTITKGRILSEEILFNGIEQLTIAGERGLQTTYRVKLNAVVKVEESDPDPSFKLRLKLNQETFREGETITFELEATQNCYVTVFNLYSLDSLRILFPNELSQNNNLEKGKTLFIPDPEAGWDIPLSLLPRSEIDVESILVVATNDDIPFQAIDASSIEGAVAIDKALTAISDWLIEIPVNQRTEDMTTYRIVKH
ncbi:DUF4384 domain-containing protein [bacterium]|nr:DUF4384 domain-containing protein [bacterium]